MRIIDLALKDIQQLVRDKRALLFLVLMPMAFTAFMGIMLSPPSGPGDPRLAVGFINQDASGTLGAELRSLLESSEAVRPIEVAQSTAEQNDVTRGSELVRDEKIAALVVVPDRFSAALLAGEPIKATVIVDAHRQAGQTVNLAVGTAASRLLGAIEAARLSTATHPEKFEAALSVALAAWQQPPIGVTVEMMNAPQEEKNQVLLGFKQSSPGMLVQFTIFGLTATATILVIERKARTLQRMLTTSMSRAAIIAGHLLAMFVVILLQETLLILFAQIFLDVNYLREPLATLLVMISFGAWIAALGLFISTLAKTDEQAVMWSLLAMFVLTALAGAWFPLDITGPAFNTIGHLTPGAWAMDGFQNIVVRGLGLTSVLLPSVILFGFAVLFFGLAVWRFKFE
ncbi:Linearmycin resistance permease protein LnrN [Thermoflexales bacterium]|nr:Linearmycin resistance permease protein LnrN [Thermoflexales bacterium]